MRAASLLLVGALGACASVAAGTRSPMAAPGASRNAPGPLEPSSFPGYVSVELATPAAASLRGSIFEVQRSNGEWSRVQPVVEGEHTPSPVEQHVRPSFLVDFDQEPIRSMCDGVALTPGEVMRRASERIARKSMAIGLVTASVAAEGREGDCSEHALLTAALLRCHGWSARVVAGLLVIRRGDASAAGMHMWVEYFDRGWHIADATEPTRHGEVAYVRFGALEDEGPGSTLQLAEFLQRWSIARVRVSARGATR